MIDSINDCEICIEGYNIIRRDRNRKGEGVVCYVSNNICFKAENCVSNEIDLSFLFRKQNQ